MGGAYIHVLKLHKHSFRDECYCRLAHLVRHVLGLRLRNGAQLRWVFWLIVRDRYWLAEAGDVDEGQDSASGTSIPKTP